MNVPFLGVGLEDGSVYVVINNGESMYVTIRDAQNILGQGTDWRNYGIDASTGTRSLHLHGLATHRPTDRVLRPE